MDWADTETSEHQNQSGSIVFRRGIGISVTILLIVFAVLVLATRPSEQTALPRQDNDSRLGAGYPGEHSRREIEYLGRNGLWPLNGDTDRPRLERQLAFQVYTPRT